MASFYLRQGKWLRGRMTMVEERKITLRGQLTWGLNQRSPWIPDPLVGNPVEEEAALESRGIKRLRDALALELKALEANGMQKEKTEQEENLHVMKQIFEKMTLEIATQDRLLLGAVVDVELKEVVVEGSKPSVAERTWSFEDQHHITLGSAILAKAEMFLISQHGQQILDPHTINVAEAKVAACLTYMRNAVNFFDTGRLPPVIIKQLESKQSFCFKICYYSKLETLDPYPKIDAPIHFIEMMSAFATKDILMAKVEELLKISLPSDVVNSLGLKLDSPFQVMTHEEAISTKYTSHPLTDGFLWIIEAPMFRLNESTGKMVAFRHPFYLPKDYERLTLEPPNSTEPLSWKAESIELLYKGVPVGRGGILNHNYHLLESIYRDVLNLDVKYIEFYQAVFKQRVDLDHGGFSLNVDILVDKMVRASKEKEDAYQANLEDFSAKQDKLKDNKQYV